MELKKALEDLRSQKKRKFDQTIDLVVNLKGVDIKRDNVSLIANIPHKFKEKKICGFFENKNSLVDTVTKLEFTKFKDKNSLRHLVKHYDFFIANARLMPSVATTFGKALGPAGKMPSPQLGIVPEERPELIKPLMEKIAKSIKIRAKESSIKVPIGKENMKDEEIIENIKAVYSAIANALPKKEENVRNVLIKFTMTKPLHVEVK